MFTHCPLYLPSIFFSSTDSLEHLGLLLSWVVSPTLSVLAQLSCSPPGSLSSQTETGSDRMDSQHPPAQLVIETLSPFAPDSKPLRILVPSSPFLRGTCVVVFPSAFRTPTASPRQQPKRPALPVNRRYGTFSLSQRVEAASVEITLVPVKIGSSYPRIQCEGCLCSRTFSASPP